MKTSNHQLKLAAAALVVVLSLTSCSKSLDLNLELKSEEGFRSGSEVAVNGHPAGKINAIIEQDGHRLAIARITDRAAIKVLREGTDREEPFLLNLSTRFAPAGAPMLVSGASIPLRTSVERITKPTTQFLDEATVWIQDHPLEICLGMAGAVCVLCLFRGAFRKIGLTLIIVALTSTTTRAATGILYSRAFFVDQQAQAAMALKDAEALLARAGRLREAGATNDTAEAIIGASLLLDSVEIKLADFPEKVDQLKASALIYIRSEEQKRLLTIYSGLVANQRLLDERATVLRRSDVGQTALMREYIRTREVSRAKLKEGQIPAILLTELKATTASSTRTGQAAVIVVTNEVHEVRIVEKAMPAPVLPPVTNWLIRTNFVEKLVTNTLVVTSIVARGSNISTNIPRDKNGAEAGPADRGGATAGRVDGAGLGGLPGAQKHQMTEKVHSEGAAMDSLRTSSGTNGSSPGRPHEVVGGAGAGKQGGGLPPGRWLPRVGVFVLAALTILTLIRFVAASKSGGAYEVILRVGNREVPFDVEAGRDAVFLGKEIFCSIEASPHPWPKISIERSAAILRPAVVQPERLTVLVNGAAVTTAHELHPGDRIELRPNGSPAQNLEFLDCAKAVPGVDETIHYAPKTTTK